MVREIRFDDSLVLVRVRVAGKLGFWGDVCELKADSLPVRRRATHAPTPSWYSVCAKVLSYRKDDAFTDKEALIEFIKTLFERRTSDEEIERSKTNDQGPPDR